MAWSSAERQSPDPRPCEGRVLVVDDEPEVRKPITINLRQAGYDVVEAENGAQAMEVLRSGDNGLMVDSILCDIRMPGVNGTEAIAYFRREFPSVPVVVLTGYPEVERAVWFLKRGVVDYLVKPVSKDQLVAAIRQAVAQHVILKDQFHT
jgi:two-component system, chemotaxis family, chemotaxis protein CheY